MQRSRRSDPPLHSSNPIVKPSTSTFQQLTQSSFNQIILVKASTLSGSELTRTPTSSKPKKMSLLSLPNELLLDIIEKVNASDLWRSSTFHMSDILKLAHTCRLLRSLSIALIYTSISSRSDSEKLHKLLTSYPHIAACVRKLTLYSCLVTLPSSMAPHPAQSKLREILGSCKRLRELRLEEPCDWLRSSFDEEILEHTAPESKGSIEAICFKGLELKVALRHFDVLLDSSEFGALTTVRILDCQMVNETEYNTSRIEQYCQQAGDSRKSESVRTFSLHMPASCAMQSELGTYFAQAMPNVKVLSIIATADCVYNTLSTYIGLGPHLTDLELRTGSTRMGCENTQSQEICKVVSKLSQKLTRLLISNAEGLEICHKLFTASEWPQLNKLWIYGLKGCEGIEPDILRDQLEKLTQARPVISIFMERPNYCSVVSWNCRAELAIFLEGDNYIAPLEVFEKLKPGYVDSENEVEWEDDYDDDEIDDFVYDYEDDDYDIEMGMEEGMSYYDFGVDDYSYGAEGGSGPSDRDMAGFGPYCCELEDGVFGW